MLATFCALPVTVLWATLALLFSFFLFLQVLIFVFIFKQVRAEKALLRISKFNAISFEHDVAAANFAPILILLVQLPLRLASQDARIFKYFFKAEVNEGLDLKLESTDEWSGRVLDIVRRINVKTAAEVSKVRAEAIEANAKVRADNERLTKMMAKLLESQGVDLDDDDDVTAKISKLRD